MPLVLFAAKCHHVYWTCKVTIACAGIAVKCDVHRVRTLLVLVHHHQGPLAVRPQHRVRGDEDVPGWVTDVTRAGKNAVLTAPRLDPFEIDHLAGKELGRRLLDFVILVHREEAESTGRRSVTAEGLSQWNVVEIIDCIPTRFEKRAHKIGPPERGECINE